MTLSYGEILQEGCFYNKNLRTAKASYSYISNGEKHTFRPHFTYYGFRYVKVEGVTDRDQLQNFKAYALYSDLEETGKLTTSNPLVNQLISNVLWGQKGNFLDVPTDCPQRDERLGWTGDTQIFAATASYNMDTCAFYTKHLKDTRLEQIGLDGGIPFVIPYLKTVRASSGLRRHSSCAWGDIATVLPWTMYEFYAEKGLLEEYFCMMKDWVQYIKKQDDEKGGLRLWNFGFHFADWLALDNYKNPDSPMGGTDNYYVASCWYAYSAHLTAKAAKVLGKTDEEKEYKTLFKEIRQAIQKEYFTENGRCAISTQTAKVLALYMDLVPEKNRNRVADDLVKQLRENNMKLETGFCGTPFLLPVLSKAGYVKEAYDIFLGEDIPGWLYEVKMGATTIWERWNSVMLDYTMNPKGMNSLNHYAYGAVLEWVYETVCGIKVSEENPGFASVIIEPKPDQRLGSALCVIDTAGGRYKSSWTFNEQGLEYEIEVPFNRTAQIKLPGQESIQVFSGVYHYQTK